MARFIKNRLKAKGQVPGSLVFLGKKKMDAPIIQLIEFDNGLLIEKEVKTIEEAAKGIKSNTVSWVNIYGLHDLDLIKRLGDRFELPTLLLENMLNTDQRPKYDDGENYDAFILKMLHEHPEKKIISAEQVSIVLGENFVLTLQERKGDVFAPVRERIRQSKGRIRKCGNDYLTFALLDTIVDNYTILIENLGQKVEDLEDRLFLKNETGIVSEIYSYKTELNYLRKSIRPVKDFMVHLLKSEDSFFQPENKVFLNELNQLVIHSTDTIELYNNLVSDQLNIYNANMGNRMNEVMKVLTIFASIFIPLTFLAGIYGMNFDYIPELKFKYAYPIFWVVVVSTIIVLFIYFKKKKWL